MLDTEMTGDVPGRGTLPSASALDDGLLWMAGALAVGGLISAAGIRNRKR